MAIQESSINYRNLIRDLAEMYPFDVAEVVVIELVANSLDAGASTISIEFDASKQILVVEDNGAGMSATQFSQYHDFAAGLKEKGTGIGFAGLGAKISFNIANRVITETRSNTFSGGSDWYLKSDKKLVWEEIQPSRLSGYGTRVEVQFMPKTLIPYSTTQDLIKLLRRHYLPLMDAKFLELYKCLRYYSSNLRFSVNGQIICPGNVVKDFGLDKVKEFSPVRAGKQYGYGVFGLAAEEYPLSPGICGVLLCTHGKVVKADLFNQFPGTFGPCIFGLVEVPSFMKFLTTSKTDFTRRGKPKEFEGLYDPIRQEFKAWLQQLGVQSSEVRGTDEATRLERELKKLMQDVPELGQFFGQRMKKNVLVESSGGLVDAVDQEGTEVTFPSGDGTRGNEPPPVDIGDQPGTAIIEAEVGSKKAAPISRSTRGGPKIAFIEAPERLEMAWVDGNDVVINIGHPSYTKVRSVPVAWRLHNRFAISCAIQRYLANDLGTSDLTFVDRMLKCWAEK